MNEGEAPNSPDYKSNNRIPLETKPVSALEKAKLKYPEEPILSTDEVMADGTIIRDGQKLKPEDL